MAKVGMDPPVYRKEVLYYFRICYIATLILPKNLRLLFKQEWDSRYQATKGEWNNTPQNGQDFKSSESPHNQKRNSQLLSTMVNGNLAEWDCTMLFYAILNSDCIHGLNPLTRSFVEDLREFRNKDFAHVSQGKFSELKFRITVRKVEVAFQALGLNTEELQTVIKQKSFTTDELENLEKNAQKLLQELQTSEKQRHILEVQLQNKAHSFCVFPPRPPHQIAGRNCEVAMIKQELSNLKEASGSSLSYCYISGNPGSGKSQLSRLVAEAVHEEAKDSNVPFFVMTLNAETPDLLLQSYASWATKVGFPHDFVRDTVSSKDMKIEEKIKNLRDLIETKIHLYSSWLLLVDQVISITSTHGLLPEPGNKQWGRGQLLMTTQDSLHIPPSSSLTSHVSIKKGMEPNDASRFLAMVSGITDHDMEDKVTKSLDYQPLPIASAGAYIKQARVINPSFGWEDFLHKFEQGKRALTEDALARINSSYPKSMTAVTTMAVEREMNADKVMKHAFSFFAVCSPGLLRLDILTNYVLNVDKDQDKEEICIRIQGSSLFLIEQRESSTYLRLHQVVFDSVKLLVNNSMRSDQEIRAVIAAVKSFNQFLDETMPESWMKINFAFTYEHIVPHLNNLSASLASIVSNQEKYLFLSTALDLSRCYHFRRLGVICFNTRNACQAKVYLETAIKLLEEKEARDDQRRLHFEAVNCSSGNLQQAQEESVYVGLACTYYDMGLLHELLLEDIQQARGQFELALSILLKKVNPEELTGKSVINWGACSHYIYNQLTKERTEHALCTLISRTYYRLGLLRRKSGDLREAKTYYVCALCELLKKPGSAHLLDFVAPVYLELTSLLIQLRDYQNALQRLVIRIEPIREEL